MKKYASILIGIAMIISPISVHADVNEQQMITLLQQLIVVLTQQLNYLLAQRGLVNPILEIQPQATTTPSIIYTTATSTFAIPVENSPLRGVPVPTDTIRPQLWEAQFAKDIAPTYENQQVVRIVTSEPIQLLDIKFHFVNLPQNLTYIDRIVAVSAIELNTVRDTQSNCWVNCDKGGFMTIFKVDTPLSVTVPLSWSHGERNNVIYGPEFSVSDSAGNYSLPWQSARDITSFVYEE